MAPICTPPNFESIIFAANALESGTDAIAAFPKSRLVNSMVFLSVQFPPQRWLAACNRIRLPETRHGSRVTPRSPDECAPRPEAHARLPKGSALCYATRGLHP